MTGLETAFLLNPGVRRRKGRVRKSSNKRSRNARGWFKTRRKGTRGAKKRRVGKRRKRRTVYTRPTRKTVRARSKRRRNPSDMYARATRYPVSTTSGRLMNPRRKKKSKSRRRRNPDGGMAGMLAVPQIIPFKVPIPGIIGTVLTNVVQGVAAGAIFTVGYLASGFVVDMVMTPADAAARVARGENFLGKWGRPLLFAGSAGLVGGLTAMVAPKGKKALFSIIAASAPGLRALGGVLKATMDAPTSPGLMADAYAFAGGMADYIQVEDYDPNAEENDGVEDYLQVEDLFEAGLGEDDSPEMVEDLYEAGLGEEAEVVGM